MAPKGQFESKPNLASLEGILNLWLKDISTADLKALSEGFLVDPWIGTLKLNSIFPLFKCVGGGSHLHLAGYRKRQIFKSPPVFPRIDNPHLFSIAFYVSTFFPYTILLIGRLYGADCVIYYSGNYLTLFTKLNPKEKERLSIMQ